MNKFYNVDGIKEQIINGNIPNFQWALTWASYNGYADIVEILLKERVGSFDVYNNAIKWATYKGHIKVVEILLQDGHADPTVNNEWAIRNANTEEIKEMLIKYKYRVDGKEYRKMKETLEK